MRIPSILVLTATLLTGCGGSGGAAKTDVSKEAVDAFLVAYAQQVRPPWKAWQEASWKAHTKVRAGDSELAELAVEAREGWEKVVAEKKWSVKVRELLRAAEDTNFAELGIEAPTPLQVAGLKAVQRIALNHKEGARDARTAMRAARAGLLRSHAGATYELDGQPTTLRELQVTLATERNPELRREAWEAQLDAARSLKSSFGRLRDARNGLAKKTGHTDHFEAVADRYGMTGKELRDWLHAVEVALRPTYRELHTYLRHELAEAYEAEVPRHLPAHWLGDATGATFSATLELPSVDPSVGLEAKGTETMLRDAAVFFEGWGLSSMPDDFWERSSLYPRLSDQKFGKLGGASTWNLDLKSDVRVMMSARAEPMWMHAAYREFAFVHTHYARLDAKLPIALRLADATALDGALAMWADIAATRPARLEATGLLEDDAAGTPQDDLMHDALTALAHTHFLVGALAEYEEALYADGLPGDQLNSRWWTLLTEHQGIAPAATRTERYADALSFTPFLMQPRAVVEEAIASVVAWHLHITMAEKLALDPVETDFNGSAEVGTVFRELGANAGRRNWQSLIEEQTGSKPDGQALVRYFEPLHKWLEVQNEDRQHTVPRLR